MTPRQVCGYPLESRLLPVTVLVMQADASFWDSLVFDGIDDVDVEAVTAVFGTVDVVAKGRAASAACPDCGPLVGPGARLLPAQTEGSAARRAERPDSSDGPAFPLRHKGLPASYGRRALRAAAAPYVRFTTRLNHVLEHVGLALAGRAGARLADQLEGASNATKTLLPELSSGRLQLGGLITYEVAKRYISIDDSGSGLLHSVHG